MGVVSATVNTVAMRKRSILPLVKWKRTWLYTHAASCLCHIVTPRHPHPQSNKVSASSLPVTFGKIWRFEMPGCIIYIRWKETTKPWVLVGDAFIDKLFFTLFAFFFFFFYCLCFYTLTSAWLLWLESFGLSVTGMYDCKCTLVWKNDLCSQRSGFQSVYRKWV